MRQRRNVVESQRYGKQREGVLQLNALGRVDIEDSVTSFKERNERTSSLTMREEIRWSENNDGEGVQGIVRENLVKGRLRERSEGVGGNWEGGAKACECGALVEG